jgi:hypothetical protein
VGVTVVMSDFVVVYLVFFSRCFVVVCVPVKEKEMRGGVPHSPPSIDQTR